MIVYLVRHGIAEDWAASGRDRDRRLTERGRKRIQQCGVGLKRLGVKLDVMLTSPFPRAAETASIIADTLNCTERLQTAEVLQSGGGGDKYVRQLLHDRTGEIMLVGHEPEMSLMAADLAGNGTRIVFKKGTVCRIDLLDANAHGEIVWLLAPKILTVLGKS